MCLSLHELWRFSFPFFCILFSFALKVCRERSRILTVMRPQRFSTWTSTSRASCGEARVRWFLHYCCYRSLAASVHVWTFSFHLNWMYACCWTYSTNADIANPREKLDKQFCAMCSNVCVFVSKLNSQNFLSLSEQFAAKHFIWYFNQTHELL